MCLLRSASRNPVFASGLHFWARGELARSSPHPPARRGRSLPFRPPWRGCSPPAFLLATAKFARPPAIGGGAPLLPRITPISAAINNSAIIVLVAIMITMAIVIAASPSPSYYHYHGQHRHHDQLYLHPGRTKYEVWLSNRPCPDKQCAHPRSARAEPAPLFGKGGARSR